MRLRDMRMFGLPLVCFLSNFQAQAGTYERIASNELEDARCLTRIHLNASAVRIDINNQEKVERLVQEADVAVR